VRKKVFFPGTDTRIERRKFAIFHACTLVFALIVAALALFIINCIGAYQKAMLLPSQSPVAVSLNPFDNVAMWLGLSLFVWNFLGSIRYANEAYDEGDRERGFIFRIVTVIYLFAFPFVYFHNLWHLIFIKDIKG